MCLDLKKKSKRQVAKKDILVYKVLRIEPHLDISEIEVGSKFTATIGNTSVEGKIQIENDDIYLCQDERNGACCSNKLGYIFSWRLDNHVNNLSIEGIDVLLNEKYTTLYQGSKVILGESYTSDLILEKGSSPKINIGLHSFKLLESAILDSKDEGRIIVVKAYIPKGANYYVGTFGTYTSYASNELRYTDEIIYSNT
jgi:hypothetical protein